MSKTVKRIALAATLIALLSGSRCTSVDIRNENFSDATGNAAIANYMNEAFNFYNNLGFSPEASRTFAISYLFLFTEYDLLASHQDRVTIGLELAFDTEMKATPQEAKNVFACMLLDNRAKANFENQDSIEAAVRKYIEVLNYWDTIYPSFASLSQPDLYDLVNIKGPTLTKMEAKFGPSFLEKMRVEFFQIVDYNGTFKTCALQNRPRNYLDDPDAAFLK